MKKMGAMIVSLIVLAILLGFGYLVFSDQINESKKKEEKKKITYYQNHFEEVANGFQDGLLLVRQDGKYGYIDQQGEIKIPFQYQEATSFYQGLAKVMLEQQYGYIDPNGTMVVSASYDWIENKEEVSENQCGTLLAARKSGKYGCLSKEGEEKIPFLYDSVTYQEEAGLVVAKISDKPFFYGEDGTLLMDGSHGEQAMLYRNEKKYFGVLQKDGAWHFYDVKKKKEQEKGYEEITYLEEGMFLAILKNRWYLIDGEQSDQEIPISKYDQIGQTRYENGKLISQPEIRYGNYKIPVAHYQSGQIAAQKDGNWGVLDKEGKWVLDPSYLGPALPYGSLVIIYSDQQVALEEMEKLGKKEPSYIYDEVSAITPKHFLVLRDQQYGLMDEKQKEVIPLEQKSLSAFSFDGSWYFIGSQDGKKYTLYDEKGKKLFQDIEKNVIHGDQVFAFDSFGVTFVEKKNQYCQITLKGKESCHKVPVTFESWLGGDIYRYQEGNKYGMKRGDEKILTPAIYDQLEKTVVENLFLVKEGNKKGIIDENGKTIEPLSEYEDIVMIDGEKSLYWIKKNGTFHLWKEQKEVKIWASESA